MSGLKQRFYALDDGAIRWMKRVARDQYWRVAPWISLDDLIQDGYLCWYIVRNKYPDVESHANRMALFKRVFNNHLHNLANARTSHPETALAQEELETKLDAQPCQLAEMMTMIAEAPAKVRGILKKLIADPTCLRDTYRTDGLIRETFNERLCRLAGVNPKQNDLHAALRAALSTTLPSIKNVRN